MKFLMQIVGSFGDVLPMIAVARVLKARGHEVICFADPYYSKHFNNAALTLVPIGKDIYTTAVKNPGLSKTWKIHGIMGKACVMYAKLSHAQMVKHLDAKTPTVAISNTLAFAGKLLSETHGCPSVMIHLSPSAFISNIKPARITSQRVTLPVVLARFMWQALDYSIVYPHYTVYFNRLRKQLGLAPIKRFFSQWIHESNVLIGMFPEWFANKQKDWPHHLQLTSFPLFDNSLGAPLPANIQEFLDAGEKPIAFTPGTYNTKTRDFFDVAVKACQRIGKRAILITPFKDQIPFPLPKGIVHFDYVPFEALLPQLAACVHHGGIGTTSQCLAAGVPQLIRPNITDQYDNSLHVERIGVSKEVLPNHFTPKNVAKALTALIDNPRVLQNCQRYAVLLATENGPEQTADVILDALA